MNKKKNIEVDITMEYFRFQKINTTIEGQGKRQIITLSYKEMPLVQRIINDGDSDILHYIKATDLISVIETNSVVEQVRIAKPEVLKKTLDDDYKQYKVEQGIFSEKFKELMKRTKTKWKSVMAFKKGKNPVYDPLPFHSQIIDKDHPVYGKLRY